MALHVLPFWRPLSGSVVLGVYLCHAQVTQAAGFPGLQALAPGLGPYVNDAGYGDAFKVYGSLDGYVDTYDSGGRSGTRVGGGGAWTNKVGVFARQSLGDDLAVQAVVEQGFNFDDDALSEDGHWKRDVSRLRLAAVAVRSRRWGKLELGKTFAMNAPSFVDPFLAVAKLSPYSSLSRPVNAPGAYALDLRPKHSLAYTTPKWHGFSLGSMLTFGLDDAAADGKMLRGGGVRLDYWSPTLAVLAGYNRYLSNPYDTATQTDRQTRNDYYSLLGLYDFGSFSVSLAWQRQAVDAAAVPDLNVVTGGLMVPVGKHLARAVVVKRQVPGRDNDAWGVMVGYDHFLNPHTAVYVRAGMVVNQGDAGQTYAAIPLAARDDTPQDLAVGVYYNF
ncbi:hypothetical protein ASF84_12350 [Pseudomonas sp. Leaf127]|uniref:porin n=1 Tax=Pseudomonas sp. Leaf127 TaxID=1736267 RepID=UPI0007024AF7|nr:porin [Pseudomonas sp. Leaf127]KQQ56082.1 hypothetical protein ASF84_12350 [Pseudomonas sp. Leaf127]